MVRFYWFEDGYNLTCCSTVVELALHHKTCDCLAVFLPGSSKEIHNLVKTLFTQVEICHDINDGRSMDCASLCSGHLLSEWLFAAGLCIFFGRRICFSGYSSDDAV